VILLTLVLQQVIELNERKERAQEEAAKLYQEWEDLETLVAEYNASQQGSN
jgi:CHASE3 domain sensor protein